MKNKILIALILLGVILFAALSSPPDQSTLWHNATVITLNDNQPRANSLLTRGEKIIAIGDFTDVKAQAPSDVKLVDLAGRTVIPGFVDAHSHFPGSGMSRFSEDLQAPPVGTVTQLSTLLERLKQRADNTSKGEWVSGFGYDQLLLAEKRHPTIAELDAVSLDHPIFIMHISGHLGIVNSKALERIAESTGQIWRETILQTGRLEEDEAIPFQQAMFDLGVFEFLDMVEAAEQEYSQAGVTTLQSSNIDEKYLGGLKLAKWLGKIPQRMIALPYIEPMGEALVEGTLNLSDVASEDIHIGAIKLIADGSIQGYTAYLTQPYFHNHQHSSDYRGYPRLSAEALNEKVYKIVSAGFQVAIHANGDASIDDALSAIENAEKRAGKKAIRPIIIHAQMATQTQLTKMKRLGITPSFFGAHTYYWGDQHREMTLGIERAAGISPMQSAASMGLRFTNHLDTPVVPMSPMLAWWTSVDRSTRSGVKLGPEEQLTPLQGLRALTIDAAWQHRLEHVVGSLEAGKAADFVVLSGNPIDTDTPVKDVRVLRTVAGGETIFPR